MSDRLISNANLSYIENSLSNINRNIEVVYNEVESVKQDVQLTQDTLQQLMNDFLLYVHQDQLNKNVQLAETRLVKVRQEIEKKFGHYDDVRRRAIGILQAVDSNLVKSETIESASEEQLLAAPAYWLAPCLIALSAWINDNKELADRAVLEAIRRNDEKTSLFFTLVARRGGRYISGKLWLERYLSQQDPHALKREIVVVIDAFSNGVFGVDARNHCGVVVNKWIDELSQKAGFIEEQHKQWKQALLSKIKQLDSKHYTHLQTYSSTWGELKRSLEEVKLHQIIYDYFNDTLNKEIIPNASLISSVDNLLNVLVSEFDEEEQPLKKQERLQELIIEFDGDKDHANSLFSQEKLFDEYISFTQLLTNCAMYPEVANSTLATQKLAIALSKEWINHAQQDIVAENRSRVPYEINIEIDRWKGKTTDGRNEQELEADLYYFVENEKKAALLKNKIGFGGWCSVIFGGFMLVFSIIAPILLLIAAFLIGFFFYRRHVVKKNKIAITNNYNNLFINRKTILLAVLSDLVDYRREYDKEDAKANTISELLEGVTPEHYIYASHDVNRKVLV